MLFSVNPELRLGINELGGLQFDWMDRPSEGLLRAARTLRRWQQLSGFSTAVCTFSERNGFDSVDGIVGADIHQRPGDIKWDGKIGSLHMHDKTDAVGREQINADLSSLVFSNELFQGIIDPKDRLYLFVKHLFYEGYEPFIHNLRNVVMRKEMTFAEVFVLSNDISVRNPWVGEFDDDDHQKYLQRLTANTGIQFFMGNLNSDKLTNYGQYKF